MPKQNDSSESQPEGHHSGEKLQSLERRISKAAGFTGHHDDPGDRASHHELKGGELSAARGRTAGAETALKQRQDRTEQLDQNSNDERDAQKLEVLDGPSGEAFFASKASELRHFKDHGQEFQPPFSSAAEYQVAAKRFTTGELPAGSLEKTRTNGDVVRYNPATQEFGVAAADGAIRTYFIPDPSKHGYATNLDYFNAQ